MHRTFVRLLGCSLAVLLSTIAARAEEQPAPAQAESPETTRIKHEPAFLRLRRDDKNKPLALETPIVTYVYTDPSKGEVQVDLIGAVHIGDKAYYETLNREFENYEALLFELVAPPDTKIPRGKKSTGSMIGFMQIGMKDMLKLEFQLEYIDYTKPNFVHADMSPKEFEESMKAKGESFAKMYFEAMGYGVALQNRNAARNPPPTFIKGLFGKKKKGTEANDDENAFSSPEADLLGAMFSKNPEHKLKIAFAEQFENMEDQMKMFEGKDGSTIVTERNRKALEVLDRELKAGKKKLGIFYGAAHLADMEQRLLKDFGLTRKDERWITAWDLKGK